MVDMPTNVSPRLGAFSSTGKQNRTLAIFLVGLVLYVYLFISSSPLKTEKQKEYLILLWSWPFGDWFPLNQCPEMSYGENCIFTDNRSFYHLANAVVIHHREVSTSKELLPSSPRPEKQYWIWFNLESPDNCPNLTMMANLFNLTMTYRADSDIFTPYGWLERHDGTEKFILPAKSKLVAWVVSNWDPNHERFKYFEALKHHIDIDLYGKYNRSLPKAEQNVILSKYKFYLAFESSRVTDYITEKLWNNAFLSGSVPIVMGPPRRNYERFIPPDSFIHVDDFSSAQQLAAYILDLDKDDNRYQGYFTWRNDFSPKQPEGWDTHYCKVCNVLKDVPSYRIMPDLEKWFSGAMVQWSKDIAKII
ncbi:3-galactosyl-N-acetylglucosaminide 4-alpha-L-fucosyltransferase FUT3-like [Hyperolius riggenbachi]|uniref:3-galactosyl-N-acetylglucosaminide 4-alpha-L-fucosyltransferase FUT3-like n=1 Tax=Hyperolius riggenbachi TaxID=752182 RepID=UPI0035A3CD39